MARQKVEDFFDELRKKWGKPKANSERITKDRISHVLRKLGHEGENTRDAVYALLDDKLRSFFSDYKTFRDGATTAQIGSHVGILQRGKGKLDREGRDYWIKPLREVGAIEPVTWVAEEEEFVAGHITPKSSNSAYRLDEKFKQILAADEDSWKEQLEKWAAEDAVRERLTLQARAAEAAREKFGGGQAAVIEAVKDFLAPAHLPDFELVYVDDRDGDRVPEEAKQKLAAVGITLSLADAFPDLIFYRKSDHSIWCVEAVTNDGEVDETKRRNIEQMCSKAGLKLAGLTTAYATYKDFAQRQSKHHNIAVGTYVWVQEDAAKHWLGTAPPEKARALLRPKKRD